MDDGKGGQFEVVYDGSVLPGIRYHLVNGLVNGGLYRFKVQALNFNGNSDFSEIGAFYACTAPTDF